MLTLTPDVDFDLDFVNARVRDGTNLILSGPTVGPKCSRWLTWLSVDSNGSLRPRLSPPSVELPWVEECFLVKTKGSPYSRLHSNTQVSKGKRKSNVRKAVSVLETAYLVRVLTTLFIGCI